jgi:hypothetical protein
MDLIPTQRATVAEHIRLENEQKWSEVPRTLVQDARAFYDFVPVGQFKGIEGSSFIKLLGRRSRICASTYPRSTTCPVVPFGRA